MPLYEYRCQACGKEIEVLQKISDSPRTECVSCGQSALVKKVTSAGFQLKGTGWYVTDFKGGTGTPTSSSKAEPSKTTETAPPSASESKPDESKAIESKPVKPIATSASS